MVVSGSLTRGLSMDFLGFLPRVSGAEMAMTVWRLLLVMLGERPQLGGVLTVGFQADERDKLPFPDCAYARL
jgi:hypothetical protein